MTATIEHEVNYAPLVIRVPEELPKLPNSDRLYGISAGGFLAVVDESWKERAGQLAVVFPAEAQISEGLASFANLYRHAELNRDPEQVGYLEDNRRVRALKLRGNVSKGLILPILDVAEYVGWPEPLHEGDSFDTLNGIELSRKYVVPTKGANLTHAQQKLKKAFKRVDEKVFPMHIETEQYLRNEGHVGDSDIIVITQKLHGTSVRFGNVPVKVQHKWYERLAAKLGVRLPEYEYALIGGSRKVIKDPGSETQNHFYAQDVWSEAALEYGQNVPKGYIVYGELVGFTPDGAPLQKGYTYEANDFDFGMDLYVYRVATVNEDGVLNDLSWDQVKRFCLDQGLNWTPELWRGPKAALVLEKFAEKAFRKEDDNARAQLGHTAYIERPVGLSAGGTGKDEGIVLRVDGAGEVPYLLKYKNDSFYLHETEELDSGEEGIEA